MRAATWSEMFWRFSTSYSRSWANSSEETDPSTQRHETTRNDSKNRDITWLTWLGTDEREVEYSINRNARFEGARPTPVTQSSFPHRIIYADLRHRTTDLTASRRGKRKNKEPCNQPTNPGSQTLFSRNVFGGRESVGDVEITSFLLSSDSRHFKFQRVCAERPTDR